MLRDAAVALIKSRLTRAGDTSLDARIIAEMQFVQEQLLEQSPVKPWFLLNIDVALTTAAGVETVPLPSNFLEEVEDEVEESPLWIYDAAEASWLPLLKEDVGVLRLRNMEGRPTRYGVLGQNIYLQPIPDDVYDLRFTYYGRDAVLNSNIENGWLRHAADWLIAETGRIIAQYVRDDVALQLFAADARTAAARLMTVDAARREAGRRRAMGDD